MYNEHLHKQPTKEISYQFNPCAGKLTFQDLKKSFINGQSESRVPHFGVGKTTCKLKFSDDIFIPLIGSSQSYCLNIVGKKMDSESKLVSSPVSDRRAKRRLIKDIFEDELEDVDMDIDYCLNRYEDIIEFPSWENQLRGLECRVEEMRYVKYDDIVKKILSELYDLWPKWNLRSRGIIIKRRLRNFKKIYIEKCITFDKYPSWRQDFELYSMRNILESKLRLHCLINYNFHENVRKHLIFDWEMFFKNFNNTGGRNLEELIEEVDNFIMKTTRITRFHWPLSICKDLLKYSKEWIHWIGEDCEDNILNFFNSIASLQRNLLVNIVKENFETFIKFRSPSNNLNGLPINIENCNDTDNELMLYNVVKQISILADEIPRCESKLFPEIFTETKYINCGNDVHLPIFRIKFHNILSTFEEEYLVLREKVNIFLGEILDPTKWKNICLLCLDYQEKLNIKGYITFSESIMVNYISKKTKLQDGISDIIRELKRFMDDYLSIKMKDIIDFYGIASSKLYGRSEIDQICSIAQVKERDLPKLKKKLEEVKYAVNVTMELNMTSETIILKFYNILHLPDNLISLIELIQNILKVDQEDIENEIRIQAKEMYEEVSNLDREIHFARRKYLNIKFHQEISRVASRFEEAEKKLKIIVEDFPLLKQRMEILELEPLNIDIHNLLTRASVFKIFSSINCKMSQFYEKSMCQLVLNVNYQNLDAGLVEMNSNLEFLRIEKLKYTDIIITNVTDIVFERMEKMVEEYNKVMPVLKMLCSEGMKDRHFNQILQSTDNPDINKETLTVKDLLSLNLYEQAEICEEVSEIANKELCLEETLKQMQQQWEDLGSSNLNNILNDGVAQSLLNEHIIKTQTILSSPFAEAIMEILNSWLKVLFDTSDILKLYKTCQLKWQTMEPIFVNEDIVYQMPEEWRLFQNIDGKWRVICSKISNCKQTTKIIESNVKEDLIDMLKDMKVIQNGFEKYLQTRKINYPRLFFLANTELLEMLAKYRNIKSVCTYLPKIFSSIFDLSFNSRGDIIAIINENNESLTLCRPIHASLSKSHLEKRLNELEKEMVFSLKYTFKKVIKDYGINFKNCEKFLSENLDQISLMYYRLCITTCIEESINSSRIEIAINTMLNFKYKCQNYMKSNDNKWVNKKILLQTLIVEIDEYITICKKLIESEVYLVDHLLWKREIRYYWKKDNLFIRMLHLNIMYSYELLSINQLIIPTKAIKKLWRHLLYAQTQYYGGIIYGPPATGKSESCKAVAALLGRHSISFNCCEQVSRGQIQDLLIGTVLSGTFLCLDEFNRLQTSTMAWFANHIVGIYQNISSGCMKYEFMENEVILKSNFIIAVTLNPDKIGRYPIPDNISPAFKNIIACTPDILKICKSYLKMNEFEHFDILSKNIITTLNILESLLIPMKHYSFKLRTLFTIITEAVRNKDENLHEYDVIKSAITCIVKPFLIEKDVSIFENVINYSFYEKVGHIKNNEVSDNDATFNGIFDKIIKNKGINGNEMLKLKCMEILKISRISKAVLLLGHSLTCKSLILEMASQILYKVEDKKVTLKIFNPSRFSQESIFGSFNNTFNEWNNGFLIEMLLFDLEDDEELWIVFDGLLDSQWAESLNSLLDSNNKLNLINGESVFLKSNIKIFFESDSVEKIAASTISRCRIIGTNDITIDLSLQTLNIDHYEAIIQMLKSLKYPDIYTKNYIYLTFYSICMAFSRNDSSLSSNKWIYDVQLIFKKFFIPRYSFLKDFNLERLKIPRPLSSKLSNELNDEQFVELLNTLIYTKQFIILAGLFGSGKTTCLDKFVSTLDTSTWEVYKFNMTTYTTATIFLDSLLETKLFRIKKNHFTVPGNRNILIILNTFNLVSDVSRSSVWEFLRCFYDRRVIQQLDGTECTVENIYFLAEYSTNNIHDVFEKIPQRMKRYSLVLSLFEHSIYKRSHTTLSIYLDQLSTLANNHPTIFYEIRYFYNYLSEHYKKEYKLIKNKIQLYEEKDNDCVIFEDEHKNYVPVCLDGYKEFLLLKIIGFKNIFHISDLPINDSVARRIAFMWKSFLIQNFHVISFTAYNSWSMEIAAFVAYIGKANFETVYLDASINHWNTILVKVINTAIIDNKKVLLFIPDNLHDAKTKKAIRRDIIQLIKNELPLDTFGPKFINELADKFYMKNSLKSTSEIIKENSVNEDFKATTNEWKKYKCIQKLLKNNLTIRYNITNINNDVGLFRDIKDYCIIDDWTTWKDKDFLSIGISILEESNEFDDIQSINFVHKMINIHNIIKKEDKLISPRNFIDFCKTYCYLCKRMRVSIETLDKRYKAGIKKLIKADEQMNFLQQELLRLQPELLRTSLETSQLICIIEKETIEVENAKEVVAANEFKANTTATNAQSLKAECENDLTEAIPALESAIDALQCIDQKDISMLKAMRYPPSGVRICMEAICILLGEKPTKIQSSEGTVILDYWTTAQKLLSEMHFLQKMRNFDRDNIPTKVIKKVRDNYLSREDFDPVSIKASSIAAEGLCKWIKGIDTYLKISEFIEPKKTKLKQAEILVKSQMKLLDSKRKALTEITERLQKLSDQFSQMSQRKEDLIHNITNCETKMGRAERLLNALINEKTKWKDKINELKVDSEVYKNNMLVGATIMEYISNWENEKKQNMIKEISSISGCKQQFKMSMFFEPTSPYLNLNADLQNTFSVILCSRKVPFIYDIQGAVLKNISYIVGDELIINDCHEKELEENIKTCIIKGKTILINNVVNPIPLCVYQICNRQIFLKKESKMIRYNNELIPYNEKFHAILCSNQRIDQFTEDFISSVCCISITINNDIIKNHLTEELLNVVASSQMSRKCVLDKNKLDLYNQLKEIEENILLTLAKSKDLENEASIDMLNEMKIITLKIHEYEKEVYVINEHLTQVTNSYMSVINHTIKIIKICMNLPILNKLYSRSLNFIIDVFKDSLTNIASDIREIDNSELKNEISKYFIHVIGMGLFKPHKQIFNFLISNILKFDYFSLTGELNLDKLFNEYDEFIKIISKNNNELFENLKNIYNIKKPVLFAYSSSISNDYLLQSLHQLSLSINCNQKCYIVSIEDIDKVKWDECYKENRWVIIENCHLGSAENISQLTVLLKKFSTNNVVCSEGFRLFITIFNDFKYEHSALFDNVIVVAMDRSFTIGSFLKFCYSNELICQIHNTAESMLIKKTLFKLCIFHFILMERSKYGVFGWYNSFSPTFTDFISMIYLYKNNMLIIKHDNFESIYQNLLELTYQGKMADENDLLTFIILAKWIFIGLNKFDNILIDGILNIDLSLDNLSLISKFECFNFCQSSLLSGLNRRVSEIFIQEEIITHRDYLLKIIGKSTKSLKIGELFLKSKKNINSSFSENLAFVFEKIPINYNLTKLSHFDHLTFCITNEINFLKTKVKEHTKLFGRIEYLESILTSKGIKQIDLKKMLRPIALIEAIKLDYAKKHDCSLKEIYCYGTISKPENDTYILEFHGCYLIGCTFDFDRQKNRRTLKELTSTDNYFIPIPAIYVCLKNVSSDFINILSKNNIMSELLSNKNHSKNQRKEMKDLNLKLYHLDVATNEYISILSVMIPSNLPELHWYLRGAKILTSPPLIN